jgi:hypothetical protein
VTDGDIPRIGRTFVCPFARVHGRPWQVEETKHGLPMLKSVEKYDYDLACTRRPNTQMGKVYVIEVCTSSWAKECGWLNDE